MYPVCAGGIAEAVTKMAMGNRIGAALTMVPFSCTAEKLGGRKSASAKDLFTPLYGAIVVEAGDGFDGLDGFVPGTVIKLGTTTEKQEISIESASAGIPLTKIKLSEAEYAWESKLSDVFPPVSGAEIQPALPLFALGTHKSLENARRKTTFSAPVQKPHVLIPVFPGTNCEYDMARAFNLSGADTKIFVFTNNTPAALEHSLAALEKELADTQILALAGGFSAGDEPDGSGKFIANVLREGRIAEQVMQLLKKRSGLVLGICNGFQALIKTGLVPYGEIRDMAGDTPTLTFNKAGRHISRIVRTRMVSAMSPWANDISVLDPRMHLVPVSHGEGRIVIGKEFAEQLFAGGQVFSQYVDEQGVPAINEPDNPNGSLFAIEGLTSPDGRVLGKMGHSERTLGTGKYGSSADLIKNVAGNPLENKYENSCQNIFEAGVRYFR
jgi:phosphoribosylformylglycinamidine synthase